MAKEASTEEERFAQPSYTFLKSYESAQKERSKALRKLRGHTKERKAALERNPMVHRDLRLLPPDVRQRILDHLKNGSFVADAAEAEKVHTSVIMAWLEKGFQAYMGDQEDEESVLYRELYLDVLQAFAQARTSAAERVHADSALSYLLYGPGREQPDREGYVKNSRVTSTAENQPISIVTTWATASHPMQLTQGGQPTYKVTYPPDYQPPRFDQSEDEDRLLDEA